MRVDDPECKKASDEIYKALEKEGVEVIYDDRNVRAGAMFADADLLGVPVRITVGPKNLKDGNVELTTRDKRTDRLVNRDDIVSETKKLIDELFSEIGQKVRPRK